ncbi:hypothetical protein H257_18147 [Aphanomyces astaci]|uniref:Uncharacterized protein n=1 Tax=Aphanomyces astaci TaxID=112090 RepID=W4FE30_APHAT|nr:hypothetical protein H257_18147 [Aphanomyces astaci]ETV65061.1 hypothetical protein H257_18147 [Aphanomyces astaci]|eukprot:XP_009845460.1 hypothetical protein H257_18147 [Aphanomyces astaci]
MRSAAHKTAPTSHIEREHLEYLKYDAAAPISEQNLFMPMSHAVYGWPTWITSSLLPFNFCENDMARRYSNLGPISNKTLMKWMHQMCRWLEAKLTKTLPESFACVFDAWTSGSTHYVAVFASFPSDSLREYKNVLLELLPINDEDSLESGSAQICVLRLSTSVKFIPSFSVADGSDANRAPPAPALGPYKSTTPTYPPAVCPGLCGTSSCTGHKIQSQPCARYNARLDFRFDVAGIKRLGYLLGLPDVVITTQRYRVNRDEAMCIVLGRLVFPTRLHTMSRTLGFGNKSPNLHDFAILCFERSLRVYLPKQHDIFLFRVQAALVGCLHDGSNRILLLPPLKPALQPSWSFFDFVLDVYGKQHRNMVTLIGDNCTTNRAFARLAGIPMVGCASHRFNLFVGDVLADYEDLLCAAHAITKKL